MLFNSSNEASWCTDCNPKNQNSFWWTVLKKMRLDHKEGPTKLDPFYSFSWFFPPPKWYLKKSKFLYNGTQWIERLHTSLQTPYEHERFWNKSRKTRIRVHFFWSFLTVKSYFFKNGPSEWVLVYALQSVHQDASFELSNGTIRWFSIFTLVRGDPFNLGGSERYPKGID